MLNLSQAVEPRIKQEIAFVAVNKYCTFTLTYDVVSLLHFSGAGHEFKGHIPINVDRANLSVHMSDKSEIARLICSHAHKRRTIWEDCFHQREFKPIVVHIQNKYCLKMQKA